MIPRKKIGDDKSTGYWRITDIELSSFGDEGSRTSEVSSRVWVNVSSEDTSEPPVQIDHRDHARRQSRLRRCSITLWQRIQNLLPFWSRHGSDMDNGPPHRGWRRAVTIAAVATGVVCLTNIILAVVGAKMFPLDDTGLVLLRSGDCDPIKRINVAIHLIINLLSTALLGASSYTMQCLSSPTRSEVDAAHAKGKSLEIGVPSVTNFFHMRPLKAILWLCLCLSTLPLHFLWNSVVFSTGATNLFTYVIANEGFLSGNSYTVPNVSARSCSNRTEPVSLIKNMYDGYHANMYTNLSIVDCYSRYTSGGGTDFRNLILITDTTDKKLMSYCGFGGRPWNGSSVVAIGNDLTIGTNLTSGSAQNFPPLVQNTTYFNTTSYFNQTEDVWRLGSYPIKYCLSETVSASHCKLQYTPFVLYVVVACNLAKLICMSVTAAYVWNLEEPIFATVGDAVASFLDHRDETTTGMCLLERTRLSNIRSSTKVATASLSVIRERYMERNLDKYDRTATIKLAEVMPPTRRDWIFMTFYVCWVCGLMGTLFSTTQFWKGSAMPTKFGAVDASTLIGLNGDSELNLFKQIMFANVFQMIFSIVYFLYNSIFTVQCGAMEWARFARREFISLRVTWPRGQQRSTYFLQLPWTYGIPLLVLQVLMHFFISQSVFLARLMYFDSSGKPVNINDMGFLAVGYSPLAIVATTVVWTIVAIGMGYHTCRHIDNRIPPHENNSMVISALCHAEKVEPEPEPQDSQGDAFLLPESRPLSTRTLMWGVTTKPEEVQDIDGQGQTQRHRFPGHCTFTDKYVELPEKDELYR